MTVARGAAGFVRRLTGPARLVLAVGLLVALWFGTVKGVERASREADNRRASDHAAVASGFAASVLDWLDAGRTEAMSLSRSAGLGAGSGAIEVFLSQPRTFARSALVFRGSAVAAASGDLSVLTGLQPRPCTTTGEDGSSVADPHLDELLAVARSSTGPVVSPIFDVPGTCRPSVAVAVSAGTSIVVVLGEVSELEARLTAGSLIASGGTRIFLITGALALEPRIGVVSVPSRVAGAVRAANGGSRRVRYPVGGAGDAQVLAAVAPVIPGWTVVLEQDAAVFDIELQNRPSLIVASVLTFVFAAVFALLALFDLRRRRAHRRAEVAKNAFFSIAGHELRTPLTVLKGFAETLSAHWDDVTEDRRRTLVERMVPQARRLDRLVHRLLVAASIQAETHTRPQVRPTAVLPALRQAADRFASQAPLHTFDVRVDPGVSGVLADPQALDQVLEHLVDNAVKYSPSGGRIGVCGVARRGRVLVVVEDEGVGLPSNRKQIFDKFVQGETVMKRVHDEGGVGLGLYIVRTLVEQMDGSVDAEPLDGGGARLIVSLRAAVVDVPPIVLEAHAEKTTGRPRRQPARTKK